MHRAAALPWPSILTAEHLTESALIKSNCWPACSSATNSCSYRLNGRKADPAAMHLRPSTPTAHLCLSSFCESAFTSLASRKPIQRVGPLTRPLQSLTTIAFADLPFSDALLFFVRDPHRFRDVPFAPHLTHLADGYRLNAPRECAHRQIAVARSARFNRLKTG